MGKSEYEFKQPRYWSCPLLRDHLFTATVAEQCGLPSSLMLHHLKDLCSDQMSMSSAQNKRNIRNCILSVLPWFFTETYSTVWVNAFINKLRFVWFVKKGQPYSCQQCKPEALFSQQDINQRRSGSETLIENMSLYKSLRNSSHQVTFVCPAPCYPNIKRILDV